jgi:hypothetical protein
MNSSSFVLKRLVEPDEYHTVPFSQKTPEYLRSPMALNLLAGTEPLFADGSWGVVCESFREFVQPLFGARCVGNSSI